VGIFDKLGKKKDDKPRADFSNVQSGSSTTAAEPPRTPPISDLGPSGTTGQSQSYTVVSGDSLSKIARRFYGDANQWPRIYEANRGQISDPDLIHPGQQLKIPGA
jgi:nucleoid-associated protein YgaU